MTKRENLISKNSKHAETQFDSWRFSIVKHVVVKTKQTGKEKYKDREKDTNVEVLQNILMQFEKVFMLAQQTFDGKTHI